MPGSTPAEARSVAPGFCFINKTAAAFQFFLHSLDFFFCFVFFCIKTKEVGLA